MTFIVYNRTDPSQEERTTSYITVHDALEEAQESFEWAIEDLELGEGFYLVEVNQERGTLNDDVIEEGISTDWKDFDADILQQSDNYYSDEELEDWGE